ncbi:MAG TPA: hypothetical protein VF177_03125 [Anaerolineae bacterium]
MLDDSRDRAPTRTGAVNRHNPTSHAIPQRFPATSQDLFNYVARLFHDSQIRCVVRMAGRIDAERMVRAIRLTLDAEPVLGCRLVEHPWRPYFERRDDLDRLPLCPVIEGGDLEAALWDFVTAPVETRVGPLVHARIFRGESDTLCVKLDHAGADGAGTIQYLSLLATTYRELSANPEYRPPYQGHLSRSQRQVFRRVGPLAVLSSLQIMPGAQTCSLPAYGDDRSKRAFAVRQIDAAGMQSIHEYRRRHGASFNDLLVTSLYRALFATLDPPPTRPCLLTLPVNLRRYLPPGRPFPVANLSGGNLLALAHRPGERYEDTLARVQAITQRFKRSFPGLMGALLTGLWFMPGFALGRWTMHQLIGRQMAQGRMAPFLSNVGIIDDRLVDFGQEMADVFGLGLISFPPGINVAASTFQGVLTLTAGYCPLATELGIVEGFLDRITRELVGESSAGINWQN